MFISALDQQKIKDEKLLTCAHVILLIGFNFAPSTDPRYWIIMNSFRENWGENVKDKIAMIFSLSSYNYF